MYYYQVHGHVLESNATIPELRLARPRAVPDLRIEFGTVPYGVSTAGYTLRLTSRYRLGSGEPLARLYENVTTYLLHRTHVADFVVDKLGRHVGVFRLQGASPDEVRLLLIGSTLSFALELRGISSLHASAISTTNGGVAFLGDVRAGKSTLAATFVEAGCSLLTDDILALNREHDLVCGNSGFPQMRLWPDEAQYFLGHYADLECVLPTLSKRRVPVGANGFGTFCDEPQPLMCVYLPVRRDPTEWGTQIEITRVSARDAVIELVRHSFSSPLVELLGVQRRYLDFFARMVQQVPMRRLIYPAGFEHLPRVRETILEDIASL